MAEALLTFGVEKLWDLLARESDRFRGVDEQLTELKSDLNLLRSFLKDAYAKKHTSELVRNCVEEMKEIVYDAEDLIETFLLKEDLKNTSGIRNRVRRFSWIVYRREIASDMGGISKRISKVIRDMQSFGVHQMIVDGSSYSEPFQEREREMRQEFARDNESDLVGLEANVTTLVGYLVEEDDVQVVSVTGIGGLGKTTLARQAFHHHMVKNEFDRLAWVSVSQDFNRKNVWQTILQNFRPKEEENEIRQMTEARLQDELFRLLETSKSLIVFDDIWKEEHWDRIKHIFPHKKGWKVLLTSRNERIAMHGEKTYINFRPECLTVEDSWTLFQRIAFLRKDGSELKVDEEMEKMGKQMIIHCGGLPLAVKVLGGLLAAKYTLHHWKRVSENIGPHLVEGTDVYDGSNSSVYHVLSLSFEELPSYLKHCFLYLAHFPEDDQISVEKLSYYWAAEGIRKPRYYDGDTIRDVGDSYIEELVNRNMVIAERDIKTERFETCHMHDMMREICLFKAKGENFLHVAGVTSPTVGSQSLGTSRRYVSHTPPTTLHVENPKLRSLLIVVDLYGDDWMLSSLSFTRLELLRVLHLSGAYFEGGKLPSSIGKLIHLRYLCLKKAFVSHLPSSLQNLKLLIYLNIDVLSGEIDIIVPNVLMGMQELRYLKLPYMGKKKKLELSKLVKLETLKHFSTRNSSLEDLRGMVRLRTLSIDIDGETSKYILSASIAGLRNLENLKIFDYNLTSLRTEEGFVLDCIATNLKQLKLYLYMPRLPDAQHLPSHLTTIHLHTCLLKEDPMPILEKLLQLKEVSLTYKSFCERRMVCSGGGFPQLQKLLFSNLEEWEEWIVEEGSMPLLHTLTIWDCQKLKELPDGLRFITSLKVLSVKKMVDEWKERFSEGGEDYYKVQHISSVKFE